MVKYCTLFLGAGLQSAIKKILNDFYKLLFLQKFKYLSKVLFVLLLCVVNIVTLVDLFLHMNFSI